MKFTISDCMGRINQALNYPALSYEDISHYFDQAVSEINTTVRISLPSFTELRARHTQSPGTEDCTVILKTDITDPEIHAESTDPIAAPETGDPTYWYNSVRNVFFIYQNGAWHEYPLIYAVYPLTKKAYLSLKLHLGTGNTAIWSPVEYQYVREFDITQYLPMDWVVLFLIPYVCFKYAVRNGDSGELFRDEYVQGFNQLYNSYNVPNKVLLANVAGHDAYKEDVLNNLSNLNVHVFTKAITQDMKTENTVAECVRPSRYDRGGWGYDL